MPLEESARLRIPYIAGSQAQKHVTHNEGVTLLDTLVQLSVIDKDLTSPPADPDEGDSYIVGGTQGGGQATGGWTGWETRVVRFIDGVWRSYLPGAGGGAGWLAFVQDEATLYVFDSAAWQQLFVAGAREVLAADRDYYVDADDGDDGNDGLSPGSGGAFATIQKAIDTAAALDLGIYDVTINIADGTYAENVVLKTLTGAGRVRLIGNASDPTAVSIAPGSGTAVAAEGIVATYEMDGIEMASASVGISLRGGSVSLYYSKIAFNGITSICFASADSALALGQDSPAITVEGNIGRLFSVSGGGNLYANGVALTLNDIPAWGTACAVANGPAFLNIVGLSVASGSATGKRYDITQNGVIRSLGGASHLPGDVAGTTATGGQYV